MKQFLVGILGLILLSACGNKKTNINPFAVITSEIDSVLHKKNADTLHLEGVPEEPKPTEADESFDDFIFSFASDDVLQRQRVVFPLPYYNGNSAAKIEKKDWKHDNLFTKQSFYTLLFDREEDMELVGNTELNSVQVEWMFIRTHKMKRYYFERIKGAWMLEAINLRTIERGTDGEDFLEFYGRFATDSLFQSKRVHDPLEFITSDPDDDFAVLETTLDVNQWFAFKPLLPTDKLSNINYGQANEDNSPTKILALKGFGNGFSNLLFFKRVNGEWELSRFEDTGM